MTTSAFADRGLPSPLTADLSATVGRTAARNAPQTPSDRWDPTVVSQAYIADYKPFTALDGEGVRCALYVSGCLFECPGCFNEAAWSFRLGTPYDDALEDRVLADLAKPYVQGLSLLGGEPMLNTPVLLRLVERVRAALPGKDVWCWTGFTFEQLTTAGHPQQQALLEQVDVLVDGPFRQDRKDLTLRFRGSTNQRVLDVPASFAAGEAVAWPRL
ncbi:anaerobic ribonucleoside-triphosphate reductase activating protein [Xylanimonas protaetiae]|uniref:Anaerobic ribonucleoside-triphosphate reductase activating protein n=1 Tax=Xylanimonas protaetiae TaxID=2509457 RepID=A0A4P6FDA4_9MICO|nr:anaerobic ribonucleoside-triphosphate reductase activating protein [Xylanimonas protaetiae]QAY71587.1 anaerobic ribonucleoside-triphosphate reductase activating protein [Xylanimonas protaetiae]